MTAEGAISGVFDVLHHASKIGDDLGQEVVGLDADEEKQWGARLADAMRREYRVLDDKNTLERIERLAAPLLKQRHRREISYSFTVLDDPAINASSILGGHIFVNKGLVAFAGSDSELQFVIGHEIGHVDLKHCVRRTSYAVRATEFASATAGTVVSTLHDLIASGYSEDEEFAADEWGARSMLATGRSPSDILAFGKRLKAFLDEQGVDTRSPEQSRGAIGALDQEIGFHFRTHPPDEERLLRLEAITAKK